MGGVVKQKKKVKPGLIELHPTESMIIVNYEMQFVNVDANGNQTVTEKQYSHKKIKIKSFNAKSNIHKIAKGVIEHCKYIHATKENKIICLLQQLRERLLSTESDDETESNEQSTSDHESSENEKRKELQIKLEKEEQ